MECHSYAAKRLEELVGGDHSQVGIACFGLAEDFLKLERLEEARANYLRARDVFEHCYGPDDRFFVRAKAGIDATNKLSSRA